MPSKAHARTTDLQTSHDAAASVKDLTEVQSRILKLLDIPFDGYTDEELVRAYARAYGSYFPSSDASIRSRRSELVAKGFVCDSGLKRHTKAGRDSTVWQLASKLF